MNGLYLYCIRKKIDSGIPVNGVDGQGKVFTLPCQHLEAVVSEVDSAAFSNAAIEQNTRNDLNWITVHAQRHQQVIEAAMTGDACPLAVIPSRFGNIFHSQEHLQEMLEVNLSRFESILTAIKEKQEWSVKVYLSDPLPLTQDIKSNDQQIIQKERALAAMPTGKAYFFKKQLDGIMNSALEAAILHQTETIFKRLEIHTERGLKGSIWGKEFTGKAAPMLLNAIYLVHQHNLERFNQEIAQLRREIKAKGFDIECSGPWPPYHFVEA